MTADVRPSVRPSVRLSSASTYLENGKAQETHISMMEAHHTSNPANLFSGKLSCYCYYYCCISSWWRST